MSFLNPFLFVAFAAAAIPVIIHLINLRKPQRVAYSTLAFFQELQKSTIRRLNIKRYLLLALRVLAVLALAAALARPFIPSHVAGWLGTGQQSSIVGIMIDNGPSMMQVDEGGPYMEQAKRAADEIIGQAGDGPRFLLVPTHGELDSGRWMRAAEARNYLDQIEPVNKGAYPSERMDFIQERIADEPGESGRAYWITDARKTQLEKLEENGGNDTPQYDHVPVTLVRVGGQEFQNVAVTNVQIDDRVTGAGVPVGVSVQVRNFGIQPAHNMFLSLEVDGERIGQYEVDLEGGQQRELLFEVIPETSGSVRGMAVLEGGTYTFDHRRYFSIEVPESRSILLVTDAGEDGTRRSYLWPVLAAASETGAGLNGTRTDIRQLRQYSLDQFDAIVLDGVERVPEYLHAELVQYVQQGRGVFFLPSEQGSMERYNRFLSQFQAGTFTGMRGTYGRFEEVASLERLSAGHLLADDILHTEDDGELRIDMPTLFHYWQYDDSGSPGSSVMLRSNLGEPLFVRHRAGDGMVLAAAMGIGPGWSNLSIKPVYAPLIFRMMLEVVAWEGGGLREHTLGTPLDRNLGGGGSLVRLVLNGEEVRPETAAGADGLRVRYPGREWSPGWLELHLDNRIFTLAVNQHISESDFTSLSLAETESFLENRLPLAGVVDITGYDHAQMRSAMASVSFGREIWSWFIWLALAFMVAECIISRQYRVETSAE
ncbi:BatA domain-containing protein [Balneolales bacterium ANBcel1]|nr:BatA domain-containing protein [Balneolales bacterium ANBcel1]